MGIEIELELGGRVFSVPQRGIFSEVDWRKQIDAVGAPLSEMLMVVGGTPTPERMAKLAFALSLDPLVVLDAMCSYSPVLAEERQWIGEHAYSSEVIVALTKLFFGGMSSPRAATLPRIGAGVATT
jgi:hypothetical protein